MKIIIQRKFEFTYYDAAVEHISHNTAETCPIKKKKKKKDLG